MAPLQPTPLPASDPQTNAPPPQQAQPPAPLLPVPPTPQQPLPQANEHMTGNSDAAELPPQAPARDTTQAQTQNAAANDLPQPVNIPTPPISAAELVKRSMEIAAISNRIKQQLQQKAERPRRKYIHASTREYEYAAYMETWRAKVERVGNINYPEAVKRRSLSGSLILDVALRPSGAVDQIKVVKSSGYRLLDQAAIDIVQLAAPYAPFPKNIRRQVDILHITRTWQFLHHQGFR